MALLNFTEGTGETFIKGYGLQYWLQYFRINKEDRAYYKQLCNVLGFAPGKEKATPIIHRALRYVNAGDPMWQGGPAAPFSGYITKGDHNEVIDQEAGQIFGMAKSSYIDSNRENIINVGGQIYLDKNTGLIMYETTNGTVVGEGISYLTPVKDEWVIGVARAKIPLIGYVRLLPSIIYDEIKKLVS